MKSLKEKLPWKKEPELSECERNKRMSEQMAKEYHRHRFADSGIAGLPKDD